MDINNPKQHLSYAKAGVDEPREQEVLEKMFSLFKKTYSFREGLGATAYPNGHFANVLDMGNGLGIAFTTDGVGTKLLVAQMLNKYDTVGIDCVANNVNDLLCLGAEPVALLDYIATNAIDEEVLVGITKGLCLGAMKAHISIPGGELAQLGDVLVHSTGAPTIDLVGSSIGIVGLTQDRKDLLPIIDGKKVRPGNLIIGIVSSGLHSNGYSLARKVLLEHADLKLDSYINTLNRTLGEELLEPTFIYVDPIINLLRRSLPIYGMVNVSGGGFLSLGRLPNEYSYVIEHLPPIPPIFKLIQEHGSLPDTEMFAAFNMGIGFCLVCEEAAAQEIIDSIVSYDFEAMILGRVIDKPDREIYITPNKLVGSGEVFKPMHTNIFSSVLA